MKKLCEERADGPARHDDRAFGSERPTRADGDGRRERLQNSDLRRHAAATKKNRFQSLWDAVPANLLRAVTSRQPDDESADDGHKDDQIAEPVMLRRLEDG